MAWDIFCFSVSLTIMFSAVLYFPNGVVGCWWPIYARAVLMDVVFWQFSKNPTNYASMADYTTSLIMLHSTCTEPFLGVIDCIGVLDFGSRKEYPPALFRASGSEI